MPVPSSVVTKPSARIGSGPGSRSVAAKIGPSVGAEALDQLAPREPLEDLRALPEHGLDPRLGQQEAAPRPSATRA